MVINVVADNLGGGSLVLFEVFYYEMLNSYPHVKFNCLIGRRAGKDIKTEKNVLIVSRPGKIATISRLMFIYKYRNADLTLNLSNFPTSIVFFRRLFPKEFLLIQNQYFFDFPPIQKKLYGYWFILRSVIIRRVVLKVLFSLSVKKNISFVVQTPHMSKLLKRSLRGSGIVNITLPHIAPKFTPLPELQLREVDKRLQNKTFWLFPASAEPHKMHLNFLKIFESICAKFNIGVYLVLTLDCKKSFDKVVLDYISNSNVLSRQVVNLGWIQEFELNKYYAQCSGIVFTSVFESYGFPYVKAIELNKPILCYKTPSAEYLYPNDFLFMNKVNEKKLMKRVFFEENFEGLVPSSFKLEKSLLRTYLFSFVDYD